MHSQRQEHYVLSGKEWQFRRDILETEIDLLELLVMLELIIEMTPKQMYGCCEYIRIASKGAKKYISEKERESGHGI